MEEKELKTVLYVHHGDMQGGAPKSLKFLLSKIDKEKYHPIIVCRNQDNGFFDDVCDDVYYNPKIKPFHCSTVSGLSLKRAVMNFVGLLPTYFQTKKMIKELKPDIIHLNSTALFIVATATKKFDHRIKVICHIREPLLDCLSSKILCYFANKDCDRFIAIDRYDGQTVDRELKKTTVIYNFVDRSQYSIEAKSDILRRELGFTSEDVVFLVLARVSRENGILELIDNWKKNCNLINNAKLVIVGLKIGHMEDYENACQKEIDNTDIHILPFRSDVIEVIASSDVMVCPFTQPHFARAIVEGAAMGKPALSTYIDGPKELIIDNETGYFYTNGSELKKAVNKLMNEVERRKMGINAYEFAKKYFDADINAEKTFSEY